MIQETRTLLGTTPCAAIDLRGRTVMRILLPDSWTTSALGLVESFNELGPYKTVYDDEGQILSFEGGTGGRMIRCDETIMQHARWVKFYSITSQASSREVIFQLVGLKDLINGTGAAGA